DIEQLIADALVPHDVMVIERNDAALRREIVPRKNERGGWNAERLGGVNGLRGHPAMDVRAVEDERGPRFLEEAEVMIRRAPVPAGSAFGGGEQGQAGAIGE